MADSVLTRLLGPNLGSRLSAHHGDADDLGLDRVFLPFAAGLFLSAGVLGIGFAVVAELFLENTPDYRAAFVGGPSAIGLATGFAVRALWDRIERYPWLIHVVLAGASVLIGVATYGSGSRFEAVSGMLFTWPAMAVGVLLERRAQYAHVALIGLSYLATLLVNDPVPLPAARWAFLIGTCLALVWLVDRLVRWLESIAKDEARSKAEAETAAELLEVASRHKSEFLASMSHELRTPLNAVIGFSDVLLTRHFGELNDDQAEYVNDIRESGQHLLALINDVLDLSKVEAGSLQIEPCWFGLPQVVTSSSNLVRPRVDAKRIALSVDLAGVEEAFGDERRIKQVLVNLLTNAVKFTPEGGSIRVRARRVEQAVVVEVIDTGVGIGPEDQAKVFDDFRQVGDAELAREGAGLGLALSRRFLELHGGEIAVESVLGQGSTFRFVLPDEVVRTAPS